MNAFDKYGKLIMAALLDVATIVHAILSDNHVSTQERVQIAIATVTAFSVWLVPNLGGYTWMKTAVAATLAGLNVLTTLIVGGLDSGDITQLVISVLTVLAVGVAPAKSKVLTGSGGQPLP